VSRPVLAVLAIAASLVAGGCGGVEGAGTGGDAAAGKQLFVQDCGGCHTLEDAGTTGTIGPNLDDSAVGTRVSGFEPSSFEAMVREQIANPDPRGKMPAGIVTGQDALNVAAYVARVAGAKLAREDAPETTIH
jgi:mono/diheme cytochrome c family protein